MPGAKPANNPPRRNQPQFAAPRSYQGVHATIFGPEIPFCFGQRDASCPLPSSLCPLSPALLPVLPLQSTFGFQSSTLFPFCWDICSFAVCPSLCAAPGCVLAASARKADVGEMPLAATGCKYWVDEAAASSLQPVWSGASHPSRSPSV